MPEETIRFGEEYDVQDYGLIDDGKYEVKIEKIDKKTSSKTGNKYLNIRFSIRDDVDQKFKNRKLFYCITQTDPNDICYNFKKINKIIMTQKGLPTFKDHFSGDFDEVIQYLCGLHLVLTVETTFDDYKSEDINVIKDWSFEPSVWDRTSHQAKTNVEISDDDLPF